MPSLPLQRTTGIIMLILAVLLIVAVFTAETPSTDADDFPEDFANVVDDEVRYLTGQAVQVAVGIFVALLGASLYAYFRAHDRYLSLIGFAGFLLMAVMFIVSSAAYITTHDLAQNLERGETIAAEAEVQEIGRMLVVLGDSLFFLSLILFAIGLIAFGAVILTRPATPAEPVREAFPTPPNWIGWIAVAAGILYLVGWLSVFYEWFFVAIIVAFILTIIWYLTFGVWLLRGRPSAS